MISVDYQGVYFVPTLSYNHLNHHWEIHVDTNNGGNSGAVDVTSIISSGATISGTCTIQNGVQTFTFRGITATGTAQYVNTGLGPAQCVSWHWAASVPWTFPARRTYSTRYPDRARRR